MAEEAAKPGPGVLCRFVSDTLAQFTSAAGAISGEECTLKADIFNRSRLLRDLKDHTAINVDVHLPLTMAELQAWAICIDHSHSTPDTPSASPLEP